MQQTVVTTETSSSIKNATNVNENIVINSFHPVRYASSSFSGVTGLVVMVSIEPSSDFAMFYVVRTGTPLFFSAFEINMKKIDCFIDENGRGALLVFRVGPIAPPSDRIALHSYSVHDAKPLPEWHKSDAYISELEMCYL
jgi:hypothetical protein